MNKRSELLKISGVVLVVAAALIAVPVLTQENFDPSAVRPSGCQSGQFQCGMIPASPERFSAIPPAASTQINHRGLPARVDLSSNMPPIGNQGQQGSCVAWSNAYYVKSYHERVERNWAYDAPVAGGEGARVFSPAFVYNQINGGRDGGSYIDDALNLIVRQGVAPWKFMPYTSSDFRRQPPQTARTEAAKYKAQNFRRIDGNNLDAIKAELNAGHPVSFGMEIDDGFYNLQSQVYDGRQGQNYGGHAMALVGYDDNKTSPRGHRGAFRVINSWGTSWGDNGYGWISYRAWESLRPYAYVLYDIQDSTNTQPEEVIQVEDETVQISPPGQVSATRGTYSDKVVVTWSRVQNATAYAVMRAGPDNPRQFAFLAYAQDGNYADTSVQVNVSYRYRIISMAQDAYSDVNASPEAEGFAQERAQPAQLTQVVGLSAVASSSGVNLTWTAQPGVNIYQVARYQGSWQLAGQANSAAFQDRNPPRDQETYYAVRATGAGGVGPWSDAVAVSVGGTNTPPATPSGLRASMGTFRDRIELEWTAVPGAQVYYIFRYDVSEQQWQGPAQSNQPRYTDSDATVRNGAPFGYTVLASNDAGNSGYAEPVMGRANPNATRAGLVLPAPTGLQSRVDAASRRVTISWSAVPNAAEYYVFRKEKDDDVDEYEFVAQVAGNATSYTEAFPGDPGDLYFYVVRTKSALGGESDNSQAVSAFVNATPTPVTHRMLPGQGFDRFAGRWEGTFWNRRNQIQPISVELENNGAAFTARIRVANGAPRTLQGTYAATSNILESGPFRMYLSDIEGAASLDITAASLIGETVRTGLSRVD